MDADRPDGFDQPDDEHLARFLPKQKEGPQPPATSFLAVPAVLFVVVVVGGAVIVPGSLAAGNTVGALFAGALACVLAWHFADNTRKAWREYAPKRAEYLRRLGTGDGTGD